MPVNILWECGQCKSRGKAQEGYHIRCNCNDSELFKVLEVYASMPIRKDTKELNKEARQSETEEEKE